MKFYLVILFIIIFFGECYSQNFIYLENFDTKQSFKGWNIQTNGVVKHTNNFKFNGETFYKKNKDSFLVFYDTLSQWNYSVNLSKKFKVIPANNLDFKCTIYSNDSLDKGNIYYKIYDKNKKNIFSFPLLLFSEKKLLNQLSGVSLSLGTSKEDTIWLKADSIEIQFHFNPIHPYDSVYRLFVIDEIYLSELLTTTILLEKQNFKIYPNPTQNILNIELQSIDNDQNHIEIYDLSGKQVYSSITSDKNIQVDVSELTQGLYIIKVYNNNFVLNQKFIKE